MDASLQRKIQLLEQELKERNADCAKLMTENRVLLSHSNALKDTQRQLLLSQDQCAYLATENQRLSEKVKSLEITLSKEQHRRAMENVSRSLQQADEGNPTTTASPLTGGGAVGGGGGGSAIAKLSHGNEIIIRSSNISSIGFRPVVATGREHVDGVDGAATTDEEAAQRIIEMTRDAVMMDVKHADATDREELELKRRFEALQRR